MLLHDARRDARVDAAGELVLLEDQDRARWDRAQIAEGLALVEAALRAGPPGAVRAAGGDRRACTRARRAPRRPTGAQIAALYAAAAGGAPVAGRRAQPRGRGRDGGRARRRGCGSSTRSPRDGGSPAITCCRRRAPICCAASAGCSEAAAAYREALALVGNEAERRFLERRLAQVSPARA